MEYYNLTQAQYRIWLTQQMHEQTSMFNIGGIVCINGGIDISILSRAICASIQSNDCFGLRIVLTDGFPMQYYKKNKEYIVEHFDFSIYCEPECELRKWADDKAKQPFQIYEEPLFYFATFKISDSGYGYFIKIHHMIFDGWSMQLLTDEIAKYYEEYSSNLCVVNRQPRKSYFEFIDSEQIYLSSERANRDKNFWMTKFKKLPSNLPQYTSLMNGKRKIFYLTESMSNCIRKYYYNSNVQINAFFIAIYITYLLTIQHMTEIVIGVPMLGRKRNQIDIMGMQVNTVPIKITLKSGASFAELQSEICIELMSCYRHQNYPYNSLIKDLRLHECGIKGLFDTSINYYNTRIPVCINGYEVDNQEFYNGQQDYGLQIIIRSWKDNRFEIDFDYRADKYNESSVIHMYECMRNTIETLFCLNSDNSGCSLYQDTISIMNSRSIATRNSTICELISTQIIETPNDIAIQERDGALSYKELGKKIDAFSKYFSMHGITENSIVAIVAVPSIDTIVAILAILRLGGVYLPIDINLPKDRIEYYLSDSNSSVIITNIDYVWYSNLQVEVLNIKKINCDEYANTPYIERHGEYAYIVYTSGSSGYPKGVLVKQSSLVNYVCWAKKMYVKSDCETFALFTSLAFDLTKTSIYVPLISGGRILIYDQTVEPEYILSKIMKDNLATVVKLTPSHLSILANMQIDNASICRFIVGGENFLTELADKIYMKFNHNVEIYNEYGPTEATVGCMIYKYRYGECSEASIPIGDSIDNVSIYLLDNKLNKVSDGEKGYIYISGDCVTAGYINAPSMTSVMFLDDPFDPGRRMYNSGDIGIKIACDSIMYVGRSDRQIKRNGYRIDFSEVERAIKQCNGVLDVIVTNGKIESQKNILYAFLLKEDLSLNNQDIFDFLSKKLPLYMMPDELVDIKEIPITINGKVNIDKLLEQYIAKNDATVEHDKSEVLLKAASKILSQKGIEITSSFFSKGGDSIKAILLASEINKTGYTIRVSDILTHSVFNDMLPYMKIIKNVKNEIHNGPIRSTPIIQWFSLCGFANVDYYFQSLMIKIKNKHTSTLQSIINYLIRFHDSMRINYNKNDNSLYYNNDHMNADVVIPFYDIRNLSYKDKLNQINRVSDSIKSEINVEKDLLFKSCIFSIDNEYCYILLIAHHLIIDSVSWGILLTDIDWMLTNSVCRLRSKTNSYQEWANKFYFEPSYDTYSKQIQRNPEIPFDYDNGTDMYENSNSIHAKLEPELLGILRSNLNSKFNTKTIEILAAALLIAISKINRKNQVCIEIESNGRDIWDDLDVSGTIGWFTKIYKLTIDVSNHTVKTLIKSIKEVIRNKSQNFIEYNNKAIRLNYLGDLDAVTTNEVELVGFGIGKDCYDKNILPFSIDINCYILKKELVFSFMYSKVRYSENTIKALINIFMHELRQIIILYGNECVPEYTPSDFKLVDITQEELDELFVN